jgi:hypothetical protein
MKKITKQYIALDSKGSVSQPGFVSCIVRNYEAQAMLLYQ